MKESKAVYVTRHKIRDDQNIASYQLDTKWDRPYRRIDRYDNNYNKNNDFSCQFDRKRDICTCRNIYRREALYFSKIPEQVYAYHGSRSYTDVGVGSVKALQRRKVKRVYLPETDDRGVGSSDLSAYTFRRTRPYKGSYYDHKKTSSKCVGGIIEYNTGCVISEKLSPIVNTKSGTTSPKIPEEQKNIEIGSNTVVKKVATVATQFEMDNRDEKVTPKKDEPKLEVREPKQTYNNSSSIRNLDKKIIDTERKFSSDSLVQHVHNLEVPSDDKPSGTSLDPMENQLEKEYRRLFATKESKPSSEKPIPEFKSASILRRRFEALRRGLTKKDEINKSNFMQKSSQSRDSTLSRKDASVTSDPPSLEARSYSDTKRYTPIQANVIEQTRPRINYNAEKDSMQYSTEMDSDCQNVKGMFKLWGKKFNLEEDDCSKKQPTQPSLKQSYNALQKSEKEMEKKESEKKKPEPQPEVKKEKRFFFFKKKPKQKAKDPCRETPNKKSENVTAGRCEITDGLTLKMCKLNSPAPSVPKEKASKASEEGEEITRKRWLQRFLSNTIESARSVNVRWNNTTYATSSSTVFEVIDTVYKNTEIFIRSHSEVTSLESYYKSHDNTKNKVNFIQDIEAWMIPKTIPDRPIQIPVKSCSKKNIPSKNIELSYLNQKWLIDQSKALSHKIELVLHSKNLNVRQKVSSDYLRIDIPKDFFNDLSSDESRRNQTSEEEVYKVIEYESDADSKKPIRNMRIEGDNNQSDIKVMVSVQDSKNLESKILKTVIKRPPTHRDVIIQGSNVNIPKRCDVIGVGIITQRDLREMRKPILKFQDVSSSDDSDPPPLLNQKKCEFAESYLQEYYKHWTPLGLDLYSCASDSHLKSCSEKSLSFHNQQGDGSKSCPNICDDYQATTIVSSCCETSSSHYKEDKMTKFFKKKSKKEADKDAGKRMLPKDSVAVFKKRKIYAQSNRSQWLCADDKPVSKPSFESRGEQDYPYSRGGASCRNDDCLKIQKPVLVLPKRKIYNKHVSLPDCDRMTTDLKKQLAEKTEGILSFKGSSACDTCKKKTSSCPKHTSIRAQPSIEIPDPPCKVSCISKSKPACFRPGSPSCNISSDVILCPPPPSSPPLICPGSPPPVCTPPARPRCPSPRPRCPPSPSPSCPPSPRPRPSPKSPPCPPSTPKCPPPPPKCPIPSPKCPTSPPKSPTPPPKCPTPPPKCPTPPPKCLTPPSKSPTPPPKCPGPPTPPKCPTTTPTCPSCPSSKPKPCPKPKPTCPYATKSQSNSSTSSCPAMKPDCRGVKPPCPSMFAQCPSKMPNPLPPPPCPASLPACQQPCQPDLTIPGLKPSKKSSTPKVFKKKGVCPHCASVEKEEKSASKTSCRGCMPEKKKKSKKNKKTECCSSPTPTCPSACPSTTQASQCPSMPESSQTSHSSCPTSPVQSPVPCPISTSPPCPVPKTPSCPIPMSPGLSLVSLPHPPKPKCPKPPKPPKKAPCHKPPCSKIETKPSKSKSKKGGGPEQKPKEAGCGQEFPWPINSQCSNPPSPKTSGVLDKIGQLIEKITDNKNECKKDCSMMKPSGCVDESPPKEGCEPQCPSTEKVAHTGCGENSKKKKFSGLFLKKNPSKKKTCAKECSAWESAPLEPGIVRLNSREKITIKLKQQTPSTEEIREGCGVILKVKDEDGQTLCERKDYGAGRNTNSVCGNIYDAKLNRISTPVIATNLASETHQNVSDTESKTSLSNLVEIQFKLRIVQGDKTTEINIAEEEDKKKKRDVIENAQEVYSVKNDDTTNEENPKNDISIKIIVKNYKPKSEKRKIEKEKHDEDDYYRKISQKFNTVSTGYSDICDPTDENENVFSVHRATINLASSTEKSETRSGVSNVRSNTQSAVSIQKTNIYSDVTTERSKSQSAICNEISRNYSAVNIEKPKPRSTVSSKRFKAHSVVNNEMSKTSSAASHARSDTDSAESPEQSNTHSAVSNVKSIIHSTATSNKTSNTHSVTSNGKSKIHSFATSNKTSITRSTASHERSNTQSAVNNETCKTRDVKSNDVYDSVEPIDQEPSHTKSKTSYTIPSLSTEVALITEDEATENSKPNLQAYDTHYEYLRETYSNYFNRAQVLNKAQLQNEQEATVFDKSEEKLASKTKGKVELQSKEKAESSSKEKSKLTKKELLKRVFQRAHSKPKTKCRVRQLRDMLKLILTDSSTNEDLTITSNELAKDVTYTSLKPNYFKNTDSMNNYYKMENAKSSLKFKTSMFEPNNYPTRENSDETDEDSGKASPQYRGCMCNKVVEKIKDPSLNLGCCCRKKTKKDSEANCDLYEEYNRIISIDAETQRTNIPSRVISTKSTESTNIPNTIVTKPREVSTNKIKKLLSTFTNKVNQDAKNDIGKPNSGINEKLNPPETITLMNPESKRKKFNFRNAADILQCYETKKAVLEIYAEKTYSNNGEHLVAKLPKFLYEKENEIEKNYDQIATNSYMSICTKNLFMMSVGR